MRVSRSEPGVVVSAAVHAGLLLAALVVFSDAQKFDDAQETVPVEVVTDTALNQIMKGEKTARELKPSQRVDKVAPPERDQAAAAARRGEEGHVPTPPPPLRRLPDPGADDTPEPTPPKRVAALPPRPSRRPHREARAAKARRGETCADAARQAEGRRSRRKSRRSRRRPRS